MKRYYFKSEKDWNVDVNGLMYSLKGDKPSFIGLTEVVMSSPFFDDYEMVENTAVPAPIVEMANSTIDLNTDFDEHLAKLDSVINKIMDINDIWNKNPIEGYSYNTEFNANMIQMVNLDWDRQHILLKNGLNAFFQKSGDGKYDLISTETNAILATVKNPLIYYMASPFALISPTA